MMEGKIKEMPRPWVGPEPLPIITPEMVRTTLRALESKGMVKYMEGGAYVPTESGWKRLMEVKTVKEETL
jgi:DNA-binding HxlR family transcriptional regulator